MIGATFTQDIPNHFVRARAAKAKESMRLSEFIIVCFICFRVLGVAACRYAQLFFVDPSVANEICWVLTVSISVTRISEAFVIRCHHFRGSASPEYHRLGLH